MIIIEYCGVCGDYSLTEKIESRLTARTALTPAEIETVECGNCDMKVSLEGEVIYSEGRDVLDLDRLVEKVRARQSIA